jgi:CubicO group peptidase (beta-lactamase class C family)
MGSVLVARGADIVFSKGYGSANVEWDIPNTPTTKFRLGSITKQFTAASILLLEQQGRLKTEDPVSQHVPDAPAAWKAVTIFHLLTHTSGIPSFTSFPEYRSRQPFAISTEKIVDWFRDKPLEFQPGEKYNYSNSGYVLLGYIIEKITGDSYERFVQQNIFTPLGMKDSGYDSNSAIIKSRAAGYSPGPGGRVNAGFVHMSIPHAAGALYSTSEDLLRWEQGLFGGKLLTPASLLKMTTPVKNDYAFGLIVRTNNGRRTISHNGGIEGFNTALFYYPDDKVTVVVLSNMNGPTADELTPKLGAMALGLPVLLPSERKEIVVPPSVLQQYVGVYDVAPTVTLTITLDGDHLMAQLSGQPALQIYPETEGAFFLKVVDAQVEFKKDDKGLVTHAVLHQNGRDTQATRRK